ncbi:MAG: phosphoribosylglycinamide formyltransferase [Actinomycetota bacterium]
MSESRFPVAVLVSGSGSNLQAILDAARDPVYAAKPVVVVSDRPNIRGLERAQEVGVATEVVNWADYDERAAFSDAVVDAAERHGAEALVLAGFMRILSPSAVDRYANRIINIHPALLPSFPGAHAVRDAVRYGVRVTGVTVHFVDHEVDHGPIITQEAIEVLPGDDEDSLSARIHEVEHRLLPAVVDGFARGRYRIEGRHVIEEDT